MSQSLVALAECVAGLEQVAVPAWVIDENFAFVWANDLAVEMWRAADRAELFARDVRGGAPEKVLARTQHAIEQARAGKVLREEWTFYPRGKPTMVLLELRGVVLSDGRFGLLNQAVPISEKVTESTQRAITMFRHTSVISVFVGANGSILEQNPAALAVFGGTDSWTSWFTDAALAEQLLRAVLAGESRRVQASVLARGQLRWHVVDAKALRDPVTGELGVLAEHFDETARVEAEQLAEVRGERIDALSATLELVEQQRREILALSAPILDVGDQTLAVPIIGRLSAEQSSEIATKLLDAVASRGASHVILDVTGVVAIDEGSASRLRQLVGALRLLGATPMITGVRPEVALGLLASGVELDGVATASSLAAGLRRPK